jgi:hypothetical protein
METTDDEGQTYAPAADESDRLTPEQRQWAHLLITQQYETQRRALPSGKASRRRSPFADVFPQVNITAC